ncbi:bifunctional metallophosphatase/5'-nucleotidase [Paenibacillus sp. y28]|uniref:bifunctional metallophosphatase/5'-nucleotidase n=1 Tax=Paenibacillus sp. y28 TaxID=3129110 RepID=UPI0030176A24
MAAAAKLVLLHTNDIHSHFEQMPKLKTAMDRITAQYAPYPVLRIDCGDHMDRMRPETDGSGGTANVAVMNATGYNVAVLGNNEGLTFPHRTIEAAYASADFHILGSNLLEANGQLAPWMVPTYLCEAGGIRVGFIGVTAYYPEFYKPLGWDELEPLSIVAGYVKQLREEADVLVVLSHLGLNHDKRMAEEIEGIDVILGGHTHHLLPEPLMIGTTAVCAAGKYGTHLGVVSIEWDPEAKRPGRISGQCLDMAGVPADIDLERLIELKRRQAIQALDRVVVTLAEPIAAASGEESPLGNLLASGLRRWTGAEIGLVNAGQLLDGLEAGPVTLERLLAICPHPINPCRMLVTGANLRRALEEALLPEFVALAIRGYGFRGKELGTLCVDGMTIRYDRSRPPYERLVSVSVQGNPLQDELRYSVGSIDMFTFGQGYLSLKEGEEQQFYMPEFLRDVLLDQLQRPEEIAACLQKHWHSAPLSGPDRAGR